MKSNEFVQVSFAKHPKASAPLLEHVELSRLKKNKFSHDPEKSHQITFYIIFAVTSGYSTHFIDFKTHEVSSGSIIFLKPGQVHHFGNLGKIDGKLFAIAPELVKAMVLDNPSLANLINDLFTSSGPTQLSDSEFKTALGVFEEIRRLLQDLNFKIDFGVKSSGFIASFLLNQLQHLESVVFQRNNIFKNDPVLKGFLDALEQNLNCGTTVSNYAKQLHVSVRTLDRRCVDSFQKSAKQLIIDRLLLEAKRILTYSSDPLKVIAEHLGFADVSAFSKFFAREEGASPGQFRQNYSSGTNI